MKISSLLLLLFATLGVARISKGPSRLREYLPESGVGTGTALMPRQTNDYWGPEALVFSIVPPIFGTFCTPGQSTKDTTFMLVTDEPAGTFTDKCNQIKDYMKVEQRLVNEPIAKTTAIVWVCPDGKYPTPSYSKTDAQFTIFADADFTPDHVALRIPAILNVTDPSHKPPIDIGNMEVLLEYDFSDSGRPAVNWLYCV